MMLNELGFGFGTAIALRLVVRGCFYGSGPFERLDTGYERCPLRGATRWIGFRFLRSHLWEASDWPLLRTRVIFRGGEMAHGLFVRLSVGLPARQCRCRRSYCV